MSPIFDDKVTGCLYGAVLGTELGMQRLLLGDPVARSDPRKALETTVEWQTPPPQPDKRVQFTSLTPLLASVAQTYIKKGDRITPEDWAADLGNDPGIAENKAFWLMDIHSTIEVLREGMNPRLSGLGAVPSGNISTGTIPVGIYHAGDPENAYLDAVEIASVTERTPAAEWAALAAAAVAEALKPGAGAESVIDSTLKVAHRHAKDVFYEINHLIGQARSRRHRGPAKPIDQERYLTIYAQSNSSERHAWLGQNPTGWAMALLSVFGDDPERLLTVSVNLDAYPSIRSPVAGAVAGALHGVKAFPEDWTNSAQHLVTPLLGLKDVTRRKIQGEKLIIREIEELTKAEEIEESLLFDKVYGCILAGAVGNAMGSVVEGRTYQEIDEQYPGGITTVLDPTRLEAEDDNQMAMLLTETYIERDGFPATARDFGETWKRKLNRDHFFYCMKNSYDLIREGMDPRITGHWSIVTGSTVMCMEPVGTYHLCDPSNAYTDATAISYMYQRGLDVVAAGILAASVAEALRPQATVDSILRAVLNVAPKSKMNTFDTREIDTPYDFISRCLEVADQYTDVLEARAELYDKCLYYHMIDPLELLGLSYAMFKIADGDVRLAAIGGTNIGRDSDTIAGRGAMLAGTLGGVRGVPSEWVQMFNEESLERIRVNAGKICRLIGNRKLPYLQGRQNIMGARNSEERSPASA